MRVLVVEDQGMAANIAVRELEKTDSCKVDVARDPLEAIARLSRDEYDVAVVDMLFREHAHDFEQRRRRGRVHLSDARLLLSGLAVLHAIKSRDFRTRPVLWTSGEPNRRLHLTFASEELRCRALCSKESVTDLHRAVQAAARGVAYIDPLLHLHLSSPLSRPLRETLLGSSTKLNVWRAMALGLHQHKDIAKVVGIESSTVRNGMEDMRNKLLELDPTSSIEGSPSSELIRYASQNWEFFLDDTVRVMFP